MREIGEGRKEDLTHIHGRDSKESEHTRPNCGEMGWIVIPETSCGQDTINDKGNNEKKPSGNDGSQTRINPTLKKE